MVEAKKGGLRIFWDNSNVWLVGKNVCRKLHPDKDAAQFRIRFSSLLEYVCQNRKIEFAYVCGSVPPVTDDVWKTFKSLGVTVETQERGAKSGKEIAVDQAIQSRISNTLLDVDEPGTIVLLTGDGNINSSGESFLKSLERAKKKNWNIELFSWEDGCSRKLKDYVKANGRYQPLDSFFDEITFIENRLARLG